MTSVPIGSIDVGGPNKLPPDLGSDAVLALAALEAATEEQEQETARYTGNILGGEPALGRAGSAGSESGMHGTASAGGRRPGGGADASKTKHRR